MFRYNAGCLLMLLVLVLSPMQVLASEAASTITVTVTDKPSVADEGISVVIPDQAKPVPVNKPTLFLPANKEFDTTVTPAKPKEEQDESYATSAKLVGNPGTYGYTVEKTPTAVRQDSSGKSKPRPYVLPAVEDTVDSKQQIRLVQPRTSVDEVTFVERAEVQDVTHVEEEEKEVEEETEDVTDSTPIHLKLIEDTKQALSSWISPEEGKPRSPAVPIAAVILCAVPTTSYVVYRKRRLSC